MLCVFWPEEKLTCKLKRGQARDLFHALTELINIVIF